MNLPGTKDVMVHVYIVLLKPETTHIAIQLVFFLFATAVGGVCKWFLCGGYGCGTKIHYLTCLEAWDCQVSWCITLIFFSLTQSLLLNLELGYQAIRPPNFLQYETEVLGMSILILGFLHGCWGFKFGFSFFHTEAYTQL